MSRTFGQPRLRCGLALAVSLLIGVTGVQAQQAVTGSGTPASREPMYQLLRNLHEIQDGKSLLTLTEQMNALAAEARRTGVGSDSEQAEAIRQGESLALALAYRNRMERSISFTSEQVAAYLAQHPGDYDEFRLSHIFIAANPAEVGKRRGARSEAAALKKARMLKRELDAGGDFVRLAERESEDADTAAQGGELSSVFGKNLMAEFLSAARQLQVGQVSKPVRGPAGYHLIRLEGRTVATLENMRQHIEPDMRDEAMEGALAALIAKDRRQDGAAHGKTGAAVAAP